MSSYNERQEHEVVQIQRGDKLAGQQEIVQTFYQCSLCQEVFDSYTSLEAHCLVHATGDGAASGVGGDTETAQVVLAAVGDAEPGGQQTDVDDGVVAYLTVKEDGEA